MAKRHTSAGQVIDAVLAPAQDAGNKWKPSRRTLRALAVGAGGLGGVVAASAGISAFRRRHEESAGGS
jgi:hypothetical protein